MESPPQSSAREFSTLLSEHHHVLKRLDEVVAWSAPAPLVARSSHTRTFATFHGRSRRTSTFLADSTPRDSAPVTAATPCHHGLPGRRSHPRRAPGHTGVGRSDCLGNGRA